MTAPPDYSPRGRWKRTICQGQFSSISGFPIKSSGNKWPSSMCTRSPSDIIPLGIKSWRYNNHYVIMTSLHYWMFVSLCYPQSRCGGGCLWAYRCSRSASSFASCRTQVSTEARSRSSQTLPAPPLFPPAAAPLPALYTQAIHQNHSLL